MHSPDDSEAHLRKIYLHFPFLKLLPFNLPERQLKKEEKHIFKMKKKHIQDGKKHIQDRKLKYYI